MPPEPTQKTSRRREKKLSVEEMKDIEQKRLRGAVSLFVYRIHLSDLFYDVQESSRAQNVVASNSDATRRSRVVPAYEEDASQSVLVISAMSARIRALEDGLAIMQSAVSSQRHPLLDDELLKIKFGAEALAEGKGTRFPEDGALSPGEEVGEGERRSEVDTSALDTLGTLTLDEEGELKYFGRSAGSETLILAGEEYLEEDETDSESGSHTDAEAPPTSKQIESIASPTTAALAGAQPLAHDSPDSLPPEIYTVAAGNFVINGFNPLSPGSSPSIPPNANTPDVASFQGGHDTLQTLLAQFPSVERGKELSQSYLDHASMFFRPLNKAQLFGDPTVPDEGVLAHIYTYRNSPASNPPTPHLVSTVFFIFALGAFFDLTLRSGKYISESETWFALGRRAMALGPDPSTAATHSANSAEDTVRALGSMATYITMAGRKYSRDAAWSGMSLAVKVAQGAGFHRDPARWGMDPRTVQKRRALWWEVFSADVSHSLALGRPPTVHPSFTDVEFPQDEDEIVKVVSTDEGEKEDIICGFWRTKHIFSRDCFMEVINATLTARAPNYATVMDLDRKVRECRLPTGFRPYVNIEEDGEEIYRNSGLALRDFYASQFRTVTMLYLHRSFFAHAMLTNPNNPFLSPFASSFLAVYRGASIIVKAAVHMFDRCAEMAGRVWFLMYHVFSAAVVVGTVVTRSPNSTLAPSALMDLKLAVDLFEKCSSTSKRNKVAFLVLKRLKEKAVKSYDSFCKERAESKSAATSPQSQPTPSLSQESSSPTSPGQLDHHFSSTHIRHSHESDVEDELELFGGQTRVLSTKKGTKIKKRKSTCADTLSTPTDDTAPSTSPTTSTILSGVSEAGPSKSSEPLAMLTSPWIGKEPSSSSSNAGSADLPTSLQPGATNDVDLDLGMGMDVTAGTGFDAAMGFGFGAGTTGTALGGLNVASMDMDMDLGFDFPSANEEFVQGSSGSNSALPPGEKVHPSLLQYLSGSGMAEESFMSWAPGRGTGDVPMPFSWMETPKAQSRSVANGSNGLGFDSNANGHGPGRWNQSSSLQFPHLPQSHPETVEDERRLSELYSSFMDFLAQRQSRPHNEGVGSIPPRSSGFGLNGDSLSSTWHSSGLNPSTTLSHTSSYNHDPWPHFPPSSFERDFSFLAQTKGLRPFGKAQAPPTFGNGLGFNNNAPPPANSNSNSNRSALEEEFLSFMRRYVSNGGGNGSLNGETPSRL
ncbi:hypothetical protein VNI00_015450 [Paramarasmius palmivorus]|uniref:Xylanolytic transcriptional activator regulatory domain-containing protein n=1 Tax=Paramarasmius palmivorus TaxID=297713 RepID=A0AAW0BJM2_9AGAR